MENVGPGGEHEEGHILETWRNLVSAGTHEEEHILEKEIDFASRFPPKHFEATRLGGLEVWRLGGLDQVSNHSNQQISSQFRPS